VRDLAEAVIMADNLQATRISDPIFRYRSSRRFDSECHPQSSRR
jgi:hypothetical protein